MRRPQFTIRALLVLMLVVAAFFGGIKFEREQRIREEQASRALVAAPSSGFSVRVVKQKDGTFVRTISPAGSQNVIVGSNSAPGFDPQKQAANQPTDSAPTGP
ncbi:MAG TPA: hypothetical protein VHI52_18825 [Verrucomicrobiae bacterium]|nr:hypothetical protein [Verrucomicrobiae bacterium]HWB08268.1 hypothetical protein [Pirellulales bacterium]